MHYGYWENGYWDGYWGNELSQFSQKILISIQGSGNWVLKGWNVTKQEVVDEKPISTAIRN